MSGPGDRLVVLVDGTIPEAMMGEVRAALPGAEIRRCESRPELEAQAAEADVVAGHLSPAALARAGRLRWVHTWSAGPDSDLYPAMVKSPVLMTSSKGNGGIPLAEHAMLLMLMLNRQAVRWIRSQDARAWGRFEHEELQGLTCGIIGLGHSGQDLALKAKAFHMKVIGICRSPRATANVDEVLPQDRLHDLLGVSDFVIVTAPRTAETLGMLGRAEFSAMKPTAFYVCISRGGIADDAALLEALRTGRIAGAGIDAHGTEPLPPDSPFWSAPNTILTPHNGATTAATRERGIRIFIENLERFGRGLELRNIVNKQVGY